MRAPRYRRWPHVRLRDRHESRKGGTLYPLLSRFESAGLVSVEWRAGDGGPGRKYYRLTDAGRSELRIGASRWALFTDLTRDVITRTTTEDTP
jgi:PadR family transcriptional regulator PadR